MDGDYYDAQPTDFPWVKRRKKPAKLELTAEAAERVPVHRHLRNSPTVVSENNARDGSRRDEPKERVSTRGSEAEHKPLTTRQ